MDTFNVCNQPGWVRTCEVAQVTLVRLCLVMYSSNVYIELLPGRRFVVALWAAVFLDLFVDGVVVHVYFRLAGRFVGAFGATVALVQLVDPPDVNVEVILLRGCKLAESALEVLQVEVDCVHVRL